MTPRLLALGDNVVDCYPDLGVMFPGGNALNVAVHARRVGASSAYVGVVGDDEAGALVRRALTDEAVDTGLLRVSTGPNAYALVRVVDGNRVFGSGDVGVSRFSVAAPDLAAITGADVVHTGECSMLEGDLARIADAARLLSFDFSERPWDYVAEHAPRAHVAILSGATIQEDPVDLVTRVAQLGPSVVAVTQGAAGATLWVDGQVHDAPAGTGEIVDTLGAGDAFIARLVVGLARGEEPPQLLRSATAYATRTCAEYGAFGHRAPLPRDFDPTGEVSASL
jgi:fructoselysine 6-kinase